MYWSTTKSFNSHWAKINQGKIHAAKRHGCVIENVSIYPIFLTCVFGNSNPILEEISELSFSECRLKRDRAVLTINIQIPQTNYRLRIRWIIFLNSPVLTLIIGVRLPPINRLSECYCSNVISQVSLEQSKRWVCYLLCWVGH